MKIIHNTALLFYSINKQRQMLQILKHMPSLFFLYKMILVEGHQQAART